MFSRILSKYMIEKVVTQKTPTVNPKKCINKLQKLQKCEECKISCKGNAITIDNGITINAESCIGCNICTTSCPAGAFIPSKEDIENKFNPLSEKVDVFISCEKEESDINIKCIAALPWEFMAYIAVERELTISIKKCLNCNEKALAERILENIEQLKVFLGNDRFNKQIKIIDDESVVIKRGYSRRDFLKYLKEESKKVIITSIPINYEVNKNSRIYRSLLVSKLKAINEHNNEQVKYSWQSLDVNEGCWGCGTCEIICPQRAISIKRDKSGNKSFKHDYTRCTHCGLCVTTCLDKAITKAIFQGDGIERIREFKLKTNVCSVCNDPIKPDEGEKCIICKRKENPLF